MASSHFLSIDANVKTKIQKTIFTFVSYSYEYFEDRMLKSIRKKEGGSDKNLEKQAEIALFDFNAYYVYVSMVGDMSRLYTVGGRDWR